MKYRISVLLKRKHYAIQTRLNLSEIFLTCFFTKESARAKCTIIYHVLEDSCTFQ